MYIHRVVIDANRINARGRIEAMNCLDAYHTMGAIELLQTSTLPVEFLTAPLQREKAREYDVIGGSALVYLTSGNVADAYPGTPIQESRLSEIERLLFGTKPFPTDRIRVQSQRDALHVDQAWQHGADYFVTDDRKILDGASALAAAGITLGIYSAEDCENNLTKYFVRHYGTSDPATLAALVRNEGPLLLGSNSSSGIAFIDVITGEELLAFEVSETRIALRAIIRGPVGDRWLTIVPSQPFVFDGPDASISIDAGPSPLLFGDKFCRAFAISSASKTLLAGRMLRYGRFLLHHACLHGTSGREAIRITRDNLEIDGVRVTF